MLPPTSPDGTAQKRDCFVLCTCDTPENTGAARLERRQHSLPTPSSNQNLWENRAGWAGPGGGGTTAGRQKIGRSHGTTSATLTKNRGSAECFLWLLGLSHRGPAQIHLATPWRASSAKKSRSELRGRRGLRRLVVAPVWPRCRPNGGACGKFSLPARPKCPAPITHPSESRHRAGIVEVGSWLLLPYLGYTAASRIQAPPPHSSPATPLNTALPAHPSRPGHTTRTHDQNTRPDTRKHCEEHHQTPTNMAESAILYTRTT